MMLQLLSVVIECWDLRVYNVCRTKFSASFSVRRSQPVLVYSLQFQSKTLCLQFWVYWPRVRVIQIFERCLPLLAKVHDFLILTILHAKMTLRV